MNAALQDALAGLNTAQRAAVVHDSGPLLILAGAGSGKTRVITVRIAWLVARQGVDPRSILAVTFTNKAAGEMRRRAAALVDRASEVTIRTFHSFGAWMLRRNATAAGLPRGFSIYDDDDVVTLLHTLYPEQKRTTMGRYARMISRAKDYCLAPEDDISSISEDPEFPTIYRRYQTRLEEIGNVDFGDLIMRPVTLLEGDPVVAQRFRHRFRHILVDEYQDSNVAQYRMLRLLGDEETTVCVVGDDDQSIYRFRGAEVRNILSFPDEFPGTTVVRLEQNYRSTTPILELAGAVVAHNTGRLGKHLFTERPGGEVPRLVLLGDQDDEAGWVLDQIRQWEKQGLPGETAILYRTNAQSRLFETTLLRAGIPYRIVGSLRFYEREEVKDTLAFLRLVANRRDEVSFRRVINKPARGIGPRALARIMDGRSASAGDLVRATEYAAPELSRKAGESAREFVRVVEGLDALVGEGNRDSPGFPETPGAPETPAPPRTDLGTLVQRVLQNSGLEQYHSEQDEVAGTQKIQNLEELANAASLYPLSRDGLVEFLEAIELDSARRDAHEEDARVVLITMHNTKGLEFERVIITGLEEGLFPRNDDPGELEEERRLFYVAVTRACNQLFLTSCRSRRLHGRFMDLIPSRFLGEIPRELLQVDGGSVGGAREGFSPGSGEEHPLPEGTTVYHDDYGTGVVVRAWFARGEACVNVRFETGMTGQFLPAYTPLERIAAQDDYGGDAW